MKVYTTIACALVACILVFNSSSVCAQQMSRVNGYSVTAFTATWDSLTSETATLEPYVGGSNDGKYTLVLPFDFPYDGVVIPQGTAIGVGANGAISLTNSAMPAGQLIGNLDHPMLIGPFSGDIKQGSDKSAGLADTMGMYRRDGTSPNQILTIEYSAFHLRGGGSGAEVNTLTPMQVKLYETTGVIEFRYRDHGLVLPSRFPTPPLSSVGLNGSSVPAFVSNVFAADIRTIPSSDLRFTPGIASVDMVDGRDLLKLYPNPASNWITVTIATGEVAKSITASDAVGRAYSLSIDDDGRVDLGSLTAGSYLLRVETNEHAYTTQVSVVR